MVVIKNSKPILYVQLKNDFYDYIRTTILLYRKLSGDLLRMWFNMNLYDYLIANNIVKVLQLIILWYIHDLNLSHVNVNEVNIDQLFIGGYGYMIVFKKSRHDYLSVHVDFRKEGGV